MYYKPALIADRFISPQESFAFRRDVFVVSYRHGISAWCGERDR